MHDILEQLKHRAAATGDLTAEEGLTLWKIGREKPFAVMAAASELREHFKGKAITLCGIVNAKSGRCAEDCRFCVQSAHYETDAPVYPMLGVEQIAEKARLAKADGADMFGIVTSGTRIENRDEWDIILRSTTRIKDSGVHPCGSLGLLDRRQAMALKESGLYRYHHNLETARSFFPSVCTTHAYDEDIETVRIAREAGLSVCSGGIIGMGETMEQRIELAMTLKELNVDSVPVNILNPRPGTPFAGVPALNPLEILMTISIYRFLLPEKDIKLCGGKEVNLRQLLPLGIVAGCNSLMTGDYLTTPGRSPALDLEMIADLGLKPLSESMAATGTREA